MTTETFHKLMIDFVDYPKSIEYKNWGDKLKTQRCVSCKKTKYTKDFYVSNYLKNTHNINCKICYETIMNSLHRYQRLKHTA